jgi:aminoglycoside phosphotransferase (APT) family kinase protein
MTREETRLERRNWKQRQEGLFVDREFLARQAAPLVPELSRGWDPANWNVEIVRSKASDRITLCYAFGNAAVVYGKVYFDPSVGRATHGLLTHLWEHGFAAGSGLEVPEALGFIKEANLLLLRAAEGTPLNEIVAAGSLEKALTAVRMAARWLAKYHATEIPGLPVQSPCQRIEILDIADALAKVAAESPDHSSLLIGMLHDLHAVAPWGDSSSPMAPLHGQFRPAHVFTDGDRATVIDIEKIWLSDPAKDVARFVHVLKKTCFEEAGDTERADQIAEEFIAEYRKLAPSNLGSLDYFRALLAFKALAKLLKSHKLDEARRQAIGELYRVEFERATHGRSFSIQLSVPSSISAALFGKEELARKAVELTSPEFIETRILPLISLTSNGHGTDCRSEIVQNTGTGRLTLRYDFGQENVFFAKLYIDDLGPRCHEINCALWEDGFNAAAHYQVPQPLAFFADHNLLLMRCVPGTPLGSAFDGNASVDLVAGSREAAKWLAMLHQSSINAGLKTGAPDSDWESLKLFRMASRLIKAAAARSDKLDTVRQLMRTLEKRIAELPPSRRFVFTHGRFHHDHVFLRADATAVIDLDRCRPSDPAKDAAEFVRVLRLTAFKEGFDMDRAEEASASFLNTYLAEIPEAAVSLGCYWAAFVFHSLLGGLKKDRAKGKRSWEELMQFYVSEIVRALDFAR